ncbi:MAG: hypothetical protein SOR74_08705 [Candidatus Faecivicinus sp.]|nr:hypothetical protein [Candidatus Faecivicinus sp.]
MLENALTVLAAVLASSGFWAFLQRRGERKDVRAQMLMGLAHDRILFLGRSYVSRGYVTQAEYENLDKYLYQPYRRLGGNGTAERIMKEVERLPLREWEETIS